MTEETKNQIVTIDTVGALNAVAIFKSGGMQKIIDAIRAEITSEVPDTSTDKGRKAIASNAFKVAKSKTLLDKMGKGLADELNATLKPINAERKLAREELDKLRDEIREPLSNWEVEQENIELARVAAEDAIKMAALLEADHEIGLLLHDKYQREADEEERATAEAMKIEYDLEAARQQKIVDDAAEAARIEAERVAAEAIATAAREATERQEEADRKTKAAVEAEKEATRLAKEQAAQAEKDRIAAAKKVENDKVEAAALAEQQRLDAIQAEKNRVAEEKSEEARQEEARGKKTRHVGAVRKAAKEAIMIEGITEAQAKAIVLLISHGDVPAVSIKY